MLRVGVLYGGRSGEHEVSLRSAAFIVSSLDPAKYSAVAIGIDRDGRWYAQESPRIIEDNSAGRILALEKKGIWYLNHFEENNTLNLFDRESGRRVSVDVVFPAVHGTYCEDGALQGLLELAMVPYVGADPVGSGVGIDKDITKRLLAYGGIPVVPWVTLLRDEWDAGRDRTIRTIKDALRGLPLFVKPARTGSSVGVKKVKLLEELAGAIDFAFQFDTKILVEEGITAREIECAVLGNADPRASTLGEVVPRHDFYSYESKYLDPDGADLIIPANIDPETSGAIRSAAVNAYKILCTSGMARVDFLLDKKSGGFYLNEINTLPGFTRISMYPKLWEHSGTAPSRLIEMLIELALERHRQKINIRTNR